MGAEKRTSLKLSLLLLLHIFTTFVECKSLTFDSSHQLRRCKPESRSSIINHLPRKELHDNSLALHVHQQEPTPSKCNSVRPPVPAVFPEHKSSNVLSDLLSSFPFPPYLPPRIPPPQRHSTHHSSTSSADFPRVYVDSKQSHLAPLHIDYHTLPPKSAEGCGCAPNIEPVPYAKLPTKPERICGCGKHHTSESDSSILTPSTSEPQCTSNPSLEQHTSSIPEPPTPTPILCSCGKHYINTQIPVTEEAKSVPEPIVHEHENSHCGCEKNTVPTSSPVTESSPCGYGEEAKSVPEPSTHEHESSGCGCEQNIKPIPCGCGKHHAETPTPVDASYEHDQEHHSVTHHESQKPIMCACGKHTIDLPAPKVYDDREPHRMPDFNPPKPVMCACGKHTIDSPASEIKEESYSHSAELNNEEHDSDEEHWLKEFIKEYLAKRHSY